MAQFVTVPPQRLQPDVLQALLEEFATRDGTDYGEQECALEDRVRQLRAQLLTGELHILYDSGSEHWDLVPRAQAAQLLGSE